MILAGMILASTQLLVEAIFPSNSWWHQEAEEMYRMEEKDLDLMVLLKI